MRKILFMYLLIFLSVAATAQVQVAKLVGKNSDDYSLGFGGYLKFAYQVSVPADVSLEVGALVFSKKSNSKYGWDVVPVKAGFRYVLTGTSAGPYIEPQVGYSVYGINPADQEFTGFIWGVGTGYLFRPIGKIRFDLGIRYESVVVSGGSLNYVMLRLTHNFGFGRNRFEEE